MKVDERRWVMITVVDGRTASKGERLTVEATVVGTAAALEIHGGEFDLHSSPYSFSNRSESGKFGSLEVKHSFRIS
jgi:hypothetical protein